MQLLNWRFERCYQLKPGWRRIATAAAVIPAVVISPPPTRPVGAQTAGDSLYAVLYCGDSSYYVFHNDLKFAFKTLVEDYGIRNKMSS